MLLAKWALLALSSVSAAAQPAIPSFNQQPNVPLGCPPLTGAEGIVTGDFNGDHKPDLAFLCGRAGNLVLFLGKGDGTFQPPVLTTVPAGSFGLMAADFNRDGNTDLFFTSIEPLQLNILLGTRNGTFRPASSFAPPPGVSFIADLNNDGIPDLAFISNPVSFLPGNGDGTFSAQVNLPAIPAPNCDSYGVLAAIAADLNGDHKTDLVVELALLSSASGSCSGDRTYVILAGQNGAFLSPVQVANVGTASFASDINLVTGDFNNDGKTDVIFSDAQANTSYTLLGNGDGSFKLPIQSVPGHFSGPFVVADFNGDGNLDLAQPAESVGALPLFLGQGDGTFQPISIPIATSEQTAGIATADFNADGKPDVAASNFSNNASVLLNTTPFNSITSILNGASFAKTQPVSPGSLVSIFGSSFAVANASFGATSIPLPLRLGGDSVTFNGIPAPLLFVNATQINAQVPGNLPTGTASVVVSINGNTTPPFPLQVAAVAPGIFTTDSGTGQAIAINSDGSLAAVSGSIPGFAAHPANPGDVLIILGTGLGAVTPPISDGAASSDTLRQTNTMPRLSIGGANAQVLFSGLSPQFVGVNQVNVVVPNVASGVVPLQIEVNGALTSSQVTIAVGKQAGQ
jgi:uncharacterized protein (TIGR03437 family)